MNTIRTKQTKEMIMDIVDECWPDIMEIHHRLDKFQIRGSITTELTTTEDYESIIQYEFKGYDYKHQEWIKITPEESLINL